MTQGIKPHVRYEPHFSNLEERIWRASTSSPRQRARIVADILRECIDALRTQSFKCEIVQQLFQMHKIPVEQIVQGSGLESLLEEVRNAGRRSSSVTTHDPTRELWRCFYTLTEKWGADILHHYGWVPNAQSYEYLKQVRKVALEGVEWSVACRRMNVILYTDWATAGVCRKTTLSKEAELPCPIERRHWMILYAWQLHIKTYRNKHAPQPFQHNKNTYIDKPLSPNQISDAGFHIDKHGLVRRRSDLASQSLGQDTDDAGHGSFKGAFRKSKKRSRETKDTDMSGDNGVSKASKSGQQLSEHQPGSGFRDAWAEPQNQTTLPCKLTGQLNRGHDTKAGNETPSDRASTPQEPFANPEAMNDLPRCLWTHGEAFRSDYDLWKAVVVDELRKLQMRHPTHQEVLSLCIDFVQNSRTPIAGSLPIGPAADSTEIDIYELSERDFINHLNTGREFLAPVLVRKADSFLKSAGTLDIMEWKRRIDGRLQRVDVQTMDTKAQSHPLREAFERIESEVNAPLQYPIEEMPINMLNLGDEAGVWPPEFVSAVNRFQLFKALASRLPGTTGSVSFEDFRLTGTWRTVASPFFNLLSSTLSWSRPHKDLWGSAYVRVLEGDKLWLTAVRLSEEDLDAFIEQGGQWCPPEGKVVGIVLCAGDALYMPPNTIHAPLSLTPTLLDGGTLLDYETILPALESLADACLHPETTNEPAPRQLGLVLEQLKRLVSIQRARFHKPGEDVNFDLRLTRLMNRFSNEVSCHCLVEENMKARRTTCKATCPCLIRGSRCTDLCARHGDPANMQQLEGSIQRGRVNCFEEK